jgi:hypothetical protein
VGASAQDVPDADMHFASSKHGCIRYHFEMRSSPPIPEARDLAYYFVFNAIKPMSNARTPAQILEAKSV